MENTYTLYGSYASYYTAKTRSYLPAIPGTPKQKIFVHLMELMASEGLVRLAWLHRWMFEENYNFVKKDFGRSFKPQGSDEELLKYGNLISDRMMSYGLPESSPAARAELNDKYKNLLALFEAHLMHHPYFLGGHPSAADYAIMGAMHAHLGRVWHRLQGTSLMRRTINRYCLVSELCTAGLNMIMQLLGASLLIHDRR